MKKRMLLLLLLAALVLDCAGSEDFEVFPGHAPVIHDWYAPSVIRPGAMYRIYLHAEDFDGDMKEIVTMVTQTGAAPFPRTLTKLKGENTHEVFGYLDASTSNSAFLLGDRLEVLLLVRDLRDNVSQPVKLSLGFDYVQPQEIPEKWQGPANRRLGLITSEYIVPSQGRPTKGDGL